MEISGKSEISPVTVSLSSAFVDPWKMKTKENKHVLHELQLQLIFNSKSGTHKHLEKSIQKRYYVDVV